MVRFELGRRRDSGVAGFHAIYIWETWHVASTICLDRCTWGNRCLRCETTHQNFSITFSSLSFSSCEGCSSLPLRSTCKKNQRTCLRLRLAFGNRKSVNICFWNSTLVGPTGHFFLWRPGRLMESRRKPASRCEPLTAVHDCQHKLCEHLKDYFLFCFFPHPHLPVFARRPGRAALARVASRLVN